MKIYRRVNIAKYFIFAHILDGIRSHYFFEGRDLDQYNKLVNNDGDRGELIEFFEFDEPPTPAEIELATGSPPYGARGWQGTTDVLDWIVVEECWAKEKNPEHA